MDHVQAYYDGEHLQHSVQKTNGTCTVRVFSQAMTDLLPVETVSPEETRAFGEKLAAVLEPGDVVALYGDLGAGKTQLVKGICAALGVPADRVNSPTFTLVNEYQGRHGPIYHVDAYRIQHADAFFELGYEEYFYSDGLCLIEWPERIEALLPERALRLRLTHCGEDRRRIAIAE